MESALDDGRHQRYHLGGVSYYDAEGGVQRNSNSRDLRERYPTNKGVSKRKVRGDASRETYRKSGGFRQNDVGGHGLVSFLSLGAGSVW